MAQSDLQLDSFEDSEMSEGAERLEEFNRVFIENWTHLRQTISNLFKWDRTADIVQFAYLQLRHRDVDKVEKSMLNWIRSGVKTVAIKHAQRNRKKLTSFNNGDNESNLLDRNVYGDDIDGETSIALSQYTDYRPVANPEEQLDKKIQKRQEEERKQKIHEAIATLSEDEEKIVREYGLQNKSSQALAAQLDLSPAGVRTKFHRAKKKLRTELLEVWDEC